MAMEKAVLKLRIKILISLLILVPLGFYAKFYSGPLKTWVNDSLCGVFYEIFWCLVFLFMFPNARPHIIAVTVFFCTCILEFMQLWNPPFLEYLRSFFIGRTILGTTFALSDFLYYLMGSLAGYYLMVRLRSAA